MAMARARAHARTRARASARVHNIMAWRSESKVERAKARVSARARSAASTRRTACKHAAELRASTQRTRAARRALQARDELRASTLRESKTLHFCECEFWPQVLPTLRSRCAAHLSRTDISSEETRPSGKYETIISKIFLKGYCLSERCATYVVFRLVFLRGL